MESRQVSIDLNATVDLSNAEQVVRIAESFSRVCQGLALEGVATRVSFFPLDDIDPDPDGL